MHASVKMTHVNCDNIVITCQSGTMIQQHTWGAVRHVAGAATVILGGGSHVVLPECEQGQLMHAANVYKLSVRGLWSQLHQIHVYQANIHGHAGCKAKVNVGGDAPHTEDPTPLRQTYMLCA